VAVVHVEHGVILPIALTAALGWGQITTPRPIPPPPDVAAPPADVEINRYNLGSKILTRGAGTVHPKVSDRVTVHYTGWTADGRMFDSSVARGAPLTIRVDRAIAGWVKILPLMVAGEKRRIWIPEWLAYEGVRAPKGPLVYDLELIRIEGLP
jgi:FKBP-type peptidyl-prolyl cis-trans isomerase